MRGPMINTPMGLRDGLGVAAALVPGGATSAGGGALLRPLCRLLCRARCRLMRRARGRAFPARRGGGGVQQIPSVRPGCRAVGAAQHPGQFDLAVGSTDPAHIGRSDPAAGGAVDDELAVGERRNLGEMGDCLLYTSPSPRDGLLSRMPSSA